MWPDRSTLTGVVARVLVAVTFFTLAIDMGGDFGLRNVVVPICALLMAAVNGLALPRGWPALLALLVVYPAVSLLLGLSNGAALPLAISQYQATAFSFVILALVTRIPYDLATSALLYSLSAVALLATGLAIGLVVSPDSVSGILSLAADRGGGHFGERGIGVGGVVPNVYFKATLFYVPVFVLALTRNNYPAALVCFTGLVAALSKTGMAAAATIATVFLARSGKRKGLVVGGLLCGVALWAAGSSSFAVLQEIAAHESGTVDVRIGHLDSLVERWSARPASLLVGFGLGSTFYSAGAGELVSNIEIDHLNVVRKYGLLWASAFFLLVLRAARAAIRHGRADVRGLGWALIVGFAVAGTNPVLTSPLFFLLLFMTMAAVDQTSPGSEDDLKNGSRPARDV